MNDESNVIDFDDGAGVTWRAQVISHGRTSAYLNPRVHKTIVQFSCLGQRKPHRYVGLPSGKTTLAELTMDELGQLLTAAKVH